MMMVTSVTTWVSDSVGECANMGECDGIACVEFSVRSCMRDRSCCSIGPHREISVFKAAFPFVCHNTDELSGLELTLNHNHSQHTFQESCVIIV